ncbi:hypothetical protein LX69_02282 [Breznakibacter xylanolyticus]|uniref:Uncharacterized protein n=1 Tax=Breznakibacter xylanolyticus TaxID=990 RepID=A0A2W7NDY0_9BACT|nr:hypothetical protein [Breznakibacter xylanolyticus]PZX14954.1 hypothetical protein LX69_02282 [Breznakibacter xylanolyticus]
MRTELERTKRIEDYILGRLTGVDKSVFEAQLASDRQLKRDVEIQSTLIDIIKTNHLKSTIQDAGTHFHHRYRFSFKNPKFNIVIIAIVAAAFLTYHLSHKVVMVNAENSSNPTDSSIIIEQTIGIAEKPYLVDTLKANVPDENTIRLTNDEPIYPSTTKADVKDILGKVMNHQSFTINNSTGGIIKGQNGTQFFFPPDAFNAPSTKANESIEIQVIEFVSNSDLMRIGLSTSLNDGTTLEIGNAFYIEAYSQGEKLQLHQDKTIQIALPRQRNSSDEEVRNMMIAFVGTSKKNHIYWKPDPITDKFLITSIAYQKNGFTINDFSNIQPIAPATLDSLAAMDPFDSFLSLGFRATKEEWIVQMPHGQVNCEFQYNQADKDVVMTSVSKNMHPDFKNRLLGYADHYKRKSAFSDLVNRKYRFYLTTLIDPLYYEKSKFNTTTSHVVLVSKLGWIRCDKMAGYSTETTTMLKK